MRCLFIRSHRAAVVRRGSVSGLRTGRQGAGVYVHPRMRNQIRTFQTVEADGPGRSYTWLITPADALDPAILVVFRRLRRTWDSEGSCYARRGELTPIANACRTRQR
ncbi:hypothetical protein GCM10010492_69980 [Saccharothrix mutabilis subsp. mutabilis]|uniref:Uncharacterized protein n=1 Tax=Saccharothrix mutabilis subsp. mutabilis TaxID=66855 RepID=A0ABN0UR83_9PSEU